MHGQNHIKTGGTYFWCDGTYSYY